MDYGGDSSGVGMVAVLENTLFLRNRGVKTIVMMLSMFFLFCSFKSWQGAAASLLLACYLQFQFWSRGHGACFDIGRGTPDETTIRRYNERWYHTPLDWLFNKMDANEHKYGFLYDFIYMGMRYTCPMAVLYFLSPVFCFDWCFGKSSLFL